MCPESALTTVMELSKKYGISRFSAKKTAVLANIVFLLVFSSCTERSSIKSSSVSTTSNDFNINFLLKNFGKFEFKGEAEITVSHAEAPEIHKIFKEKFMLKSLSDKSFEGYIRTDDKYGIDFIYSKNIFCLKLRYGTFVCRHPDEDEISTMLKRIFERYIFVSNLLKSKAKFQKNGKETIVSLASGLKTNDVKTKLDSADFKEISGKISVDKNNISIFSDLFFKFIKTNSAGAKILVKFKYKHVLKHFSGKISLPPENKIIKNTDRKRPLLDRKKLLGKTIPAPLDYLY